jgi:hypothetical protein
VFLSTIQLHQGRNVLSINNDRRETIMPGKRTRGSEKKDSSKPAAKKHRQASWSAQEDHALLRAVAEEQEEHGEGEEDWDTIAEELPGKSAVQ